MKKFIVEQKQNGKKIIQVLTSVFPGLPLSAIHKALRQKDIKINGTRVKEDKIIYTGDLVEVYIKDDIILNSDTSCPEIVYEDPNIIILNKPQGLKVHPDKEKNSISLIEILKGKYGPGISLCHRLDRNTGGLIIAGKDKLSTEIILEKIKNNEISKIYRCKVYGKMPESSGILKAWHLKNSKDSLALISNTPKPGFSRIITKYTLLSYDPITDTSILDIDLVTGKTHQIRAHLAHIGHPVVGDGKYGSKDIKKNRDVKSKYQALYSYKLIFAFSRPAGKLYYLKNKSVEIEPPI